jgi:hypothetical protein
MPIARPLFVTSLVAVLACSSAKEPGGDASAKGDAPTEVGAPNDGASGGDVAIDTSGGADAVDAPAPPVEGGGDTSADFAGAIQSFCQTAAQVVCLTSCNLGSVATCRATIVANCVAQYGAFADLGSAGRFSIDPATAAACIDDIYGACEFLMFPPGSCQRIFAGTVADGQPCLQSSECKSGTCDRGTPPTCPGKCAPGGALGDDCDVMGAATCDPRVAYCKYGQCVALLTDGTPCDPGDTCVNGDFCDWASPPSCGPGGSACACKPLGSLGVACLNSEQCRPDLKCVGGKCTAPGSQGAPCDPLSVASCQGNLYCFYSADASSDGSGLCGDRVPEGGSCDGLYCQEGLECVPNGPDSGFTGTCQTAPPPTPAAPPLADGQPCSISPQCASQLCYQRACAKRCTLADLK